MKTIQTEADEFNNLLIARKIKVVCAESVTAGLLASTIASVSGASRVLLGSIVTYSELVKTAVLKVPVEILKQHSAESKETTRAMVDGLLELYPDAELYVAVTGVASEPVSDDYSILHAVGTIFVCIWYAKEHYDIEHIITTVKGRNQIREATVSFIFENISKILDKGEVSEQ